MYTKINLGISSQTRRKGRPAFFSVEYDEKDTIGNILPIGVSYSNGFFYYPQGLTEFSFTDGTTQMTADFVDGLWMIGQIATLVPYVGGVITNIMPSSADVTYSDGNFVVPSSVTAFTFEDDGVAYESTWDGTTWVFITTYNDVPYVANGAITAILPSTVSYGAGNFSVHREVDSFTFNDNGVGIIANYDGTWSFVELFHDVYYTPNGNITNVSPVSVIYDTNKFTVPDSLMIPSSTVFTFTDNGVSMSAFYTGSGWVIDESTNQVAYVANGIISNIFPSTVIYGSGNFSVPVSVTSFTFTDSGVEMSASYSVTWTIVEVTHEVAYVANGVISNISVGTVTYNAGNFTVPSSVTSFTFTDDGVTVTATLDGTWSFVADAPTLTTYYVSNAGNDVNDGLTISTAWKTLDKVGSVNYDANTRILLRRGDVWNENLWITSSGASGQPITYGAYGTGAKPIINGRRAVPNWDTGGTSYSDWYMPNLSEMYQMFAVHNGYGKGTFDKSTTGYWVSDSAGSNGYFINMDTGADAYVLRTNLKPVRPLRDFEAGNIYEIGDDTITGGWIIYKTDLGGGNYKYYEAAPEDLPPVAWSNTTDHVATLTGIGNGKGNTDLIVGQAGHTNSAAQDCLDYSISAGAWTNEGSNTWSLQLIAQSKIRIWIDGEEKLRSQTANVSATHPWQYISGTSTLYIYSTSDPASAFTSMETTSFDHFLKSSIGEYPTQKNYITFEGIDIRGWHSCNVMGCSNWVIDNVEWGRDFALYGLVVFSDGDILSTGSEVKNSTFDTHYRLGEVRNVAYGIAGGYDAIMLRDGVTNWDIHDNYFRAWGHSTYYIDASGGTRASEGNIFYRNFITHIDGDYGRALNIDIRYLSQVNVANPNKIYDNIIDGQATQSQIQGPYSELYNNIFIRSRGRVDYGGAVAGHAITIDGYAGLPYRMKVVHNIFAFSQGYGLQIGDLVGRYVCSECDFSNNIMYMNEGKDMNNDPTGANKIQLCIDDNGNGSNINNTYKNNLIYTSLGSTPVRVNGQNVGVSTFNTLSGGSNGHVIANNVTGNPLFVNEASDNYHLQLLSPAVSAGLDVGVLFDAIGILRGTPPDIGPLEYTEESDDPTQPVQILDVPYNIPTIKSEDDYTFKVYIDPTYTGTNGTSNGTIERPFTSFNDQIRGTSNFKADCAYLIKRGTTLNEKIGRPLIGWSPPYSSMIWNNNMVGAYGSGNMPIIRGIAIYSGSNGITIRDLDIYGESVTPESYDALVYMHDTSPRPNNTAVAYCKIHGKYNGSNYATPYPYPMFGIRHTGDNWVCHRNEIYDLWDDAIYVSGNDHQTYTRNWMHDISKMDERAEAENWPSATSQDPKAATNIAGTGDCIHSPYLGNNWYYAGNIFDKSNARWKFSVIWQGGLTHAKGINFIVEYNTILGPRGGASGTAVYWNPSTKALFQYNIVDGTNGGSASFDGRNLLTAAGNNIATHLQLEHPFGIHNNHFIRQPQENFSYPENESLLNPSNDSFIGWSAYQTYLSSNPNEIRGADIDTTSWESFLEPVRGINGVIDNPLGI